jgi:hypothetical protein
MNTTIKTLKTTLLAMLAATTISGCKTNDSDLKDDFAYVPVARFASWTCTASDQSNRNRQEIRVQVAESAEYTEDALQSYNGHTIHVMYRAGGQDSLTMRIDNAIAMVYDVKKSLHKLEANNVTLQCYTSAAPRASRVDSRNVDCGADYQSNSQRQDLVTNVTSGSTLISDRSIDWLGFRLEAIFSTGSVYESQQYLKMAVNNSVFTVYDPGPNLYWVSSDEMRIQCYNGR